VRRFRCSLSVALYDASWIGSRCAGSVATCCTGLLIQTSHPEPRNPNRMTGHRIERSERLFLLQPAPHVQHTAPRFHDPSRQSDRRGVAFDGPGVVLARRGVAFEGPGVVFARRGVAFEGPGVVFARRGVAFEGPGVVFAQPGVVFAQPGVAFAGCGVAFAECGVGPALGDAPSPGCVARLVGGSVILLVYDAYFAQWGVNTASWVQASSSNIAPGAVLGAAMRPEWSVLTRIGAALLPLGVAMPASSTQVAPLP
jgi:hypothetical protein